MTTPSADVPQDGLGAGSVAPGAAASCCEDFAISRRTLFRGILGTGAATALFGTTFVQTAYAAKTDGNVLVVLSLRGAADGLSMVVPYGDPAYYTARPGIAIPKGKLLATDGFFGLHPNFKPLLPMWKAGKMAAVNGTGLPAPNRSHFAAMEEVEDANPGSAARVGWLNRLVGRDSSGGVMRGMGMGMSTPITALYGPRQTVTTTSVEGMTVSGADSNPGRMDSIRTLWGKAPGAIGAGGRDALAAVKAFGPVRRSSDKPAHGAKYADDDLGRALAASARTIRANIGVEVIAVDHDGGWDMHSGLGTLEWGQMRTATTSLATNLAAFFSDLGSLGDRVTVVTISEFGRRVAENANYGLDHGYGNVMFLLGAGVKGGYHGKWTRLHHALDDDVPVSIDYRSVLAEVVGKRLNASSTTVFPGFKPAKVGAIR